MSDDVHVQLIEASFYGEEAKDPKISLLTPNVAELLTMIWEVSCLIGAAFPLLAYRECEEPLADDARTREVGARCSRPYREGWPLPLMALIRAEMSPSLLSSFPRIILISISQFNWLLVA
jgi:hypothetical protein